MLDFIDKLICSPAWRKRWFCATITYMAIVGIFWWWYGAGWLAAVKRVIEKISGLYDYFSIDLLLKTLFSPFRQISAGRVDGPLNIVIRAFFDRLLSRVIGAIVRTIVVFIGLFSLAVAVILGLAYIISWALIPLIPFAGMSLMLAGWMPWR